MHTNTAVTSHAVTAIILAGGQGRRVNGADKGLLRWANHTLIEQVISIIKPQVETILISANRNEQVYRSLGYPVISDLRTDYPGPLAGIEACGPHCETALTLVVSCDAPALPGDLVARLLPAAQRTGSAYAITEQREHYLTCLMNTDFLRSVSDYLDSGRSSVKGWLEQLGSEKVLFSEAEDAFQNINQL